MATSVDLLFSQQPLPAGPVALVFGDTGEVTVYEGTLAGALPGPTLIARAARPNDALFSASLPSLALLASAAPPNDATLASTLPALRLAAEALILTGIVYESTLAGVLPGPTLFARAARPNDASLSAPLPALTVAASLGFSSNVSRPTVGQVSSAAQSAIPAVAGMSDRARSTVSLPAGVTARSTDAERLQAIADIESAQGLKVNLPQLTRHQAAAPLRQPVRTGHEAMLHDRRPSASTRHQRAVPLRLSASLHHAEMLRDRRPSANTRHQAGAPLRATLWSSHQIAAALHLRRRARSQQAMRPPAGLYVPPVVPEPNLCYTPDPNLVFWDRTQGTNLIFICGTTPEPGGTVVVPVRRVYMVSNNVSLVRLDDGAHVPVLTASLSLDVDSWVWGFSASLPGAALALVEPGVDGPVELLASINGTAFHLIAEQVSRERVFGQSGLRISGRGRHALLDAPYAPAQTFANIEARTSQQLMDDVLTLNGVSLGWSVDWGLEAWNVPAGVFSHQGSYISALVAIANAGGGYLLPHGSAKSFKVRPRYPVAPWNWASASPDFVLPSAVVTRESMAWTEKPAYNRVFVSAGHSQGVLGQVTRAGTAGDLVAPMVVEQLATTAAAARQRGLSILADTGRQIEVGLRLPVLPETGIIRPGALVQYQDGPLTRLGMVRSVGIDAGMPEVWQTLGVEVHA